jgi:hypothetical protein
VLYSCQPTAVEKQRRTSAKRVKVVMTLGSGWKLSPPVP